MGVQEINDSIERNFPIERLRIFIFFCLAAVIAIMLNDDHAKYTDNDFHSKHRLQEEIWMVIFVLSVILGYLLLTIHIRSMRVQTRYLDLRFIGKFLKIASGLICLFLSGAIIVAIISSIANGEFKWPDETSKMFLMILFFGGGPALLLYTLLTINKES